MRQEREIRPMGLMGLMGPMGQIGPMGPISQIGQISPISPIRPIWPIRPIRPIWPIRLIRRIGLISLIALMGLTGCSSEGDGGGEQPKNDQKAISFHSGLSEGTSVTRATGLEAVKTTFKVWGYKNDAFTDSNYTSYQTVMPGFTVNWTENSAYTTTSNTNDWEYVGVAADQTIKYWDFGAKAYRFFGVAPADATYGANAPDGTYAANGDNGDQNKLMAATVTADVSASTDESVAAAPYFSDLWFSNGNAGTYPNQQFGKPVTLSFRKPFARVRFMFTFAEGLTFGRKRLYEPSFKPETDTEKIATAGTVTVSYPLVGSATAETWNTSNITGTIDEFNIDYYEADDDYTPTDTETATVYDNTPQKWYTVLPQTHGNFIVSVKVVTSEIKTAVVPAEYMNWKAGYEYTYKFKITESGGVDLEIVQVGINSWDVESDVKHTVYNW